MKTLIKWVFYLGVLQMVFVYCGPHWVIGGILCSLVAQNLKPSDSVPFESAPAHQSSQTEQSLKAVK